jgi:hypothetical protein
VNLRIAIFIGLLLTSLAPLRAQTGRLRIRVTDPTGEAVPGAEVSLIGSFDLPVRTIVADDAGETAWANLPSGELHFEVVGYGPDFGSVDIEVLDQEEKIVSIRLEPVDPAVEAILLETIQMPYSQTLDLAPVSRSKPAKRHWWQIFR